MRTGKANVNLGATDQCGSPQTIHKLLSGLQQLVNPLLIVTGSFPKRAEACGINSSSTTSSKSASDMPLICRTEYSNVLESLKLKLNHAQTRTDPLMVQKA